jgi:hypothetical protein
MKIDKLLFALLLVIFFTACKNDTPQYNGQKTTFFDLKSYFKTEIERLKKEVKTVKKTVTVNGKSEEKTLENLNFEEELAPFIASDINRPAWSDYYMEKSESLDNQGFRKEYYAQKDHLKTRSIVIDKDNGKMAIQILNADETVATKSETHLSYDNRVGYTISTIQKLMGKADTIKVNVQFLQNQ